MGRIVAIYVFCIQVFCCTTIASAHFGVIVPSFSIIEAENEQQIELELKFIHPFEGHYMEMARPKRFGLSHNGKVSDLSDLLQPAFGKGPGQTTEFSFWKASVPISRPGDYTFFFEPVPYWEPAEEKFIVHYTKVCINAHGLEKGWDKPLGLETEIIPMTRPYGLWTGNLFTGQVLLKGKPVPYGEIEVEYLNHPSDFAASVKAPAGPYITQVIKADNNGIFSYAMPMSGWWGFAALNEAGWMVKKDGKPRRVEIGAVYWVHATDMR
jgi:cobalt/nickel transport protein